MRLPLLVLVALLLAGCSSAPEDGAEADQAPPSSPGAAPADAAGDAAPLVVEVFTFNGSYAAGVAEMTGELEPSSHPIEVRAGAQRIVVELTWTGSGDMDAVLESPFACYEPEQECALDEAMTRGTGDGRFQDADEPTPDSPSVVELDAAQIEANSDCRRASRCGWFVQAYPTAGANLAWTLRATVEYAAAP